MEKSKMTPVQSAAYNLLQHDFRYVYTILTATIEKILPPDYFIAIIPYIGLITDGAENWVSTMNRLHPGSINIPEFTPQEKKFYQAARSSIKLWEMPYPEIYNQLQKFYTESEQYFSSVCKPIAKTLNLYNIFGAYIIDGHFSGNTILWALILPDYHLSDKNYGPTLRNLATIAGAYITKFEAAQTYSINDSVKTETRDFGGSTKSPVGNTFSYKFVLFSLLCQLNFLIYGVDNLIVEEIPTKLRFSYILYYYLCSIMPQVNSTHNTNFSLDTQYQSGEFRNAMAHYKLGVYLKPDEVITGDPMFGMTQKAFGLEYHAVKHAIISELTSLSGQIEKYLGL